MSIIAFSGKIGSGKDTAGLILQYLNSSYRSQYSLDEWLNRVLNHNSSPNSSFINKKFADKIKDIVCLLTNCTRKQLEVEEFKNTFLGPEWVYYKVCGTGSKGLITSSYNLHVTQDDGLEELRAANTRNKNAVDSGIYEYAILKFTHTRRSLLQLIGTECGRKIIHPDIWVNALMSEYIGIEQPQLAREVKFGKLITYPDWVITDVRFPNEVAAIKKKNGKVIRIIRPETEEETKTSFHESETALDSYTDFDYTILNDGTIYDLMEKIKPLI